MDLYNETINSITCNENSSFKSMPYKYRMYRISKISYKLVSKIFDSPKFAMFLLLCKLNNGKKNGKYKISIKRNGDTYNSYKSRWVLKNGFPIYLTFNWLDIYVDEPLNSTEILLLCAFKIDILIK